MDDTISRQMALNAFWELDIELRPSAIDAITDMLKKLPSTEPEVVRCKDCKWYDLTYPYGTVVPDAFHCKINGRFYEISHFCGYAKRRADGTNDE